MYVHTKICTGFRAASFIVLKNRKWLKDSSSEWMNKWWNIHPPNGILLSNKKEPATWLDLKDVT